MARRERSGNLVETTLSSGMTDSATSASVNDGSGFPSEGDYRIAIDQELMLVTARSGNTLTVVRGSDDTTKVAHSSATPVYLVQSKAGMDMWTKDAIMPWQWNGKYPHRLLDASGNTLNLSSFTWVNQGTASAANDAWGGITLTAPQATDSLRVLKRTLGTEPWTVTGRLQMGPEQTDETSHFGLVFRQNSTGELTTCALRGGLGTSAEWLAETFDNATTPNTELATIPAAAHVTDCWFQVHLDSNLMFRVSRDGHNFFEFHMATTSFLMPDEVGFYFSNHGTASNFVHLLSWIEESS